MTPHADLYAISARIYGVTRKVPSRQKNALSRNMDFTFYTRYIFQ
jgi:hypothetical protein